MQEVRDAIAARFDAWPPGAREGRQPPTFVGELRKAVLEVFVRPVREADQLGTLSHRHETWHYTRVRALTPRHDRATPYREDAPIIVCRVRGQEFLVDGSNRVNPWTRERREACPVIVVEVPACPPNGEP